MLFLKDSPLAVFEIVAAPEAEILFVPESVPEERFVLDVTSVGIMRLGNALTCDLVLRQDISAPVVTSEAITWTAHPVGGSPYRVRVRAAGSATATTLHGRPGWLARGRLTVLVEILPDGVPADPLPPRDFPTLAAEQAARWARVWSASSVDLPAGEELWQERYRASLFQVAQSMGDGPTHPGGLSKPLTPYWRGCFHDTDTYFCRALCTAGLLSEARRHLDFRTSTLPQARAHAASHGRSGVMFPWQVEADGGGDACDVPINSAIIACEAWHQHGFHGDDTSLAQALDILDGVLDHLGDLLADGGGLTPGPIMTFSETMFSEDPTEVRVALRAVAEAWLAASARSERDDPRRAALAQRMLASLPLPLADDGSYVFADGGDPAYLRCPSVTLGLFPLHHLAPDDRLEATFAKELARILLLFAWLPHQASIVAALCGRSAGPSGAAALLRQEEVFVKPWYAVDEWENRRTARAAVFVTAAGGFCLAIQHLLLAERALGEAELFRACPSAWRTCGFTDLRTRSGWIVSARMEDGAVIRLEARPAHTRCTPILRLRLPDGSERQFVAPLIVAPQSGKGQRP